MPRREDPLVRFEKCVLRDPSGCWLWRGMRNRGGYGVLRLHQPRRKVLAHRFSYEQSTGLIPAGLCVCHKCDVRACVRPDHLWLGTVQENNADMIAKGRYRGGPTGHGDKISGERNGNCRLSDADVVAIISSDESAKVLAAKYGVTASHIRCMRKGIRRGSILSRTRDASVRKAAA